MHLETGEAPRRSVAKGVGKVGRPVHGDLGDDAGSRTRGRSRSTRSRLAASRSASRAAVEVCVADPTDPRFGRPSSARVRRDRRTPWQTLARSTAGRSRRRARRTSPRARRRRGPGGARRRCRAARRPRRRTRTARPHRAPSPTKSRIWSPRCPMHRRRRRRPAPRATPSWWSANGAPPTGSECLRQVAGCTPSLGAEAAGEDHALHGSRHAGRVLEPSWSKRKRTSASPGSRHRRAHAVGVVGVEEQEPAAAGADELAAERAVAQRRGRTTRRSSGCVIPCERSRFAPSARASARRSARVSPASSASLDLRRRAP